MSTYKKGIWFLSYLLLTNNLFAGSINASEIEKEQLRIQQQRKVLFGNESTVSSTKNRLPKEDAEQNQLQKITPERKELFDPNNPAVKHAARVFPNIPTPCQSGVNIEDTVKQYQRIKPAPQTENLMIFASFTMPKESLKRLVHQANMLGASIIIRGFKNNTIKATALAIRELGEEAGNVVINPNSFVKYQIQAVPTVVLTKAANQEQVDASDHALASSFVAVPGDVSLDYSLAEIARMEPQFSAEANRYLKQLGDQ